MTDRLRNALARWDVSRTRTNAELVDDAAAEAVGAWTPPAPEHPGFHRAWIVAARDPAKRGWAATTLCAGLADGDRERVTMLAKRVETLRAHGPDPRIARALLELLRTDPGALAHGRVTSAWRSALAHSFDEPAGQAVRAWPQPHPPEIARALLELAGPRPRTRGEPGTTRPFESLPSADEILALWREALANPRDDGPRAVLADLLLADGDARGELISLQLAAEGRERDQRVADLMTAHGRRWLGPLDPIALTAQFRRGFVARLALKHAGNAAHDAVLGNPIVATIEDLLPGDAAPEVYGRWVASPALVSLRRVQVADDRALDGIAERRMPLGHVAVPNPDAAWITSQVVPVCRARGVRSLAVPAAAVDWLVAARALDDLDVLSVAGDLRAILARWRELPEHLGLAVTRSAELEGCNPTPWDARIELRRVAGEVLARISGLWMLTSLDAALAALPGEVARIEVADASNEIALRIATAIARPVTVVASRYASGNIAP